MVGGLGTGLFFLIPPGGGGPGGVPRRSAAVALVLRTTSQSGWWSGISPARIVKDLHHPDCERAKRLPLKETVSFTREQRPNWREVCGECEALVRAMFVRR